MVYNSISVMYNRKEIVPNSFFWIIWLYAWCIQLASCNTNHFPMHRSGVHIGAIWVRATGPGRGLWWDPGAQTGETGWPGDRHLRLKLRLIRPNGGWWVPCIFICFGAEQVELVSVEQNIMGFILFCIIPKLSIINSCRYSEYSIKVTCFKVNSL